MSLVLKLFCGEDISQYPAINGARSVKKLKNELIPALSKSENAEKDTYIKRYEELLGEIVITDDSAVKTLECEISAIISGK